MHPRGGGGGTRGGGGGGGARGYSTRCIRNGGTNRLSHLIRPRRSNDRAPTIAPEHDSLVAIVSVQLSRVNMKCSDVKARLIPLLSKQFVTPMGGQSGESVPDLYWINLDLSENSLADDGISALMEWWSRHVGVLRLRTLKLYRNLVADRGASAIAALVEQHPWPLEELHLSHNSITDAGATRLFEAFVRARGSLISPNSASPPDEYLYPRYDPNVGLRLPVWMRLEYNLVDDCPRILAGIATALQDRHTAGQASSEEQTTDKGHAAGGSRSSASSPSERVHSNNRAPSSAGSSVAAGYGHTNRAVCFAEKLGAPSMKDPGCAPKKCAKASAAGSPLFHLFSFTHQLRRRRSTEPRSPAAADGATQCFSLGGTAAATSDDNNNNAVSGEANKRTRLDHSRTGQPPPTPSGLSGAAAAAQPPVPPSSSSSQPSPGDQTDQPSPSAARIDHTPPSHQSTINSGGNHGQPRSVSRATPGTPPVAAVSAADSSQLSLSCPPHQATGAQPPPEEQAVEDRLPAPPGSVVKAQPPTLVAEYPMQDRPEWPGSLGAAHTTSASDVLPPGAIPPPTGLEGGSSAAGSISNPHFLAGGDSPSSSDAPVIFCRVFIDGQATVAMAADPHFRNPTSLLSRELCGLSSCSNNNANSSTSSSDFFSSNTNNGAHRMLGTAAGVGGTEPSAAADPTPSDGPIAPTNLRTFPALTWRWLADQAMQSSGHPSPGQSPAGYEPVKIVLPTSAEQEALMAAVPLGIRTQVESALKSCVDPLNSPHAALLDKPIDIDSSETSLTAEENAVARAQFHLSAFALQTMDTALTSANRMQTHPAANMIGPRGCHATLLVTANPATVHFMHWLKQIRWNQGHLSQIPASFSVVPLTTYNEALSQVAQAGGAFTGDSVSAAIHAVVGSKAHLSDSRLSLAQMLAAAALVARQKAEAIQLPMTASVGAGGAGSPPPPHLHSGGFLPHTTSHPPHTPSPLEIPSGRKFPPILSAAANRSSVNSHVSGAIVAPAEANRSGRASSDLQAQQPGLRPHLLYGDSQPAFPVARPPQNNAPETLREMLFSLQRLRSNLLAAQAHQEPPASSLIRDVELVTSLARSLAASILSPSSLPPTAPESQHSSTRVTDILTAAAGSGFAPSARDSFPSRYPQATGSRPSALGGPPDFRPPASRPAFGTAAVTPLAGSSCPSSTVDELQPPPHHHRSAAGPPPTGGHPGDFTQLVTHLNQIIAQGQQAQPPQPPPSVSSDHGSASAPGCGEAASGLHHQGHGGGGGAASGMDSSRAISSGSGGAIAVQQQQHANNMRGGGPSSSSSYRGFSDNLASNHNAESRFQASLNGQPATKTNAVGPTRFEFY